MITDHGGQKNHNGKPIAVLFAIISTNVWYVLFCKLTSTHGLNVDSFLSTLEVVVRCGDQSLELKLDMEVSAKRKAHCVGQVGEERRCVLDCDGFFEWGWMCRLFCFARVDDVM
jgi:hypothetical protein